MVLDYNTPPPRGFKPSDEAFEYYNLALSLGYKEYLQKEYGRSLYYYNQDYRSSSNMSHAKEYAIANQQTTTTSKNKKGDSVFSSFEPTTTVGEVITNIADTIIPSVPEVEASGIYAPDITTGGFYYGPPEKEDEITTTTTPTTSTTLPPFLGTITNVLSKTAPLLPRLLISNITKNSVVINWNSVGDGGSPIINWHYVLKNKDNNQTIKELNFNAQQLGIVEMNLISGTNYKAYVIAINAFGNSDENGISFKTLGSIPVVTTPTITISAEAQTILDKFEAGNYDYKNYPPFLDLIEFVKNGKLSSENFVITINGNLEIGTIIDKTIPVTTPTITISAEAQAILTKFDNNDYTSPTWFNNNIEYVKDGRITSNEFLDVFNDLLQQGIIIDKTIPVEKEYDVNTYRINEFGGIFNQIISGIDGNRLLELEKEFLVTLVGEPTPSDQEIYDFYNFVDTSIPFNSITQKIGAFTLKDGKLKGRIDYETTKEFNAYYYNKPIYSVVQINDQYGADILSTPKVNTLNFTAQENTEYTIIDENVGDINAVKIQFHVSKNANTTLPFSQAIDTEIVCMDCFPPCQIGQHRNFNGKCVADDQSPVGGKPTVIALLGGVTALIGTLALLGSKRR